MFLLPKTVRLIDDDALNFRLMFGLVYMALVWMTPAFKGDDDQFPFYYYLIVLIIYAVHQVRPRLFIIIHNCPIQSPLNASGRCTVVPGHGGNFGTATYMKLCLGCWQKIC